MPRLLSVPAAVAVALALFASSASAAPTAIGHYDYADAPDVVANPDGDAFVAWSDSPASDDSRVDVCRIPKGTQTCDRKHEVELGDVTSLDSALARDPATGKLVLVWNVIGSIYVQTSADDGETWTSTVKIGVYGADHGGEFGLDHAIFGPGQFSITIGSGYGDSDAQTLTLPDDDNALPGGVQTMYAKGLIHGNDAATLMLAPITNTQVLAATRVGDDSQGLLWRAFTGQLGPNADDVAQWTPTRNAPNTVDQADDVGNGLSGNYVDPPVVIGTEPTSDPTQDSVVVRRYDVGTNSFSAPATIATEGDPIFPSVALSTGGDVDALWVSTDRRLMYSASSDGSTFPTPVALTDPDADVRDMRLAAGDDGTGVATWGASTATDDGGHRTLYVDEIGGPASFSTPPPPPTSTTPSTTPTGPTTPVPTTTPPGSTPPGSTPPPTSTCSKLPKLGIAQLRAIAGCFGGSGTKLTISTPFLVNGVTVDPGGQTAKVDTAARTLELPPSTTLAMTPIKLAEGERTLTFPTTGTYAYPGTIDLSDNGLGAKLLGLEVKGESKLTFKTGESQLATHITLPSPFDGYTADVKLRANNFVGLRLDGIHAHVDQLPFKFHDLDFAYVADPPTWRGTVGWSPTATDDYSGSFSIKDGALEYLKILGRFGVPGKLVATNVFIPAAGLDILTKTAKNPLEFIGKVIVGVGAGGKLVSAGNYDVSPSASATSNADDYGTVAVGLGDPFFVKVDSNVYVLGQKLGTGYVHYYSPFTLAFGANAEVGTCGPGTIVGAGVAGSFNGGVAIKDDLKFDLEATSKVCTPIGSATGKAVLSSRGVAGCASIAIQAKVLGQEIGTTVEGGVAHYWNDDIIDWDVLGGCDSLADYSVAIERQAGGPPGFNVGPGLKQLTVGLAGAPGAPPVATLVGPGGERVEAVAPGGSGTSAGAVGSDVATGTVTYAIPRPAAGRWTIVPSAGSAPITSTRFARDAPSPQVSATVRRVGSRVVLRYDRKNRTEDTTASFVAEGGGTTQVLGAAKGARGTLRFAPTLGPGGTRKIYAVVERGGFAVAKLPVASYTAPSPPRAGTARRLRASREGSTVTLRWTRGRAVTDQELVVTRSDGVKTMYAPRKGELVLRGVPSTVTLRVALSGRDALARSSKQSRLTVRVARRTTRRR